MNMRQLNIFFREAKTWQAIVCLLFCFCPFLPEFICFEPKIVLNIKNKTIFGIKQLNSEIEEQEENTKVNKQLVVMFWLHWRKYGSVSYSFSCKTSDYQIETKKIWKHQKSAKMTPICGQDDLILSQNNSKLQIWCTKTWWSTVPWSEY